MLSYVGFFIGLLGGLSGLFLFFNFASEIENNGANTFLTFACLLATIAMLWFANMQFEEVKEVRAVRKKRR